MYAEAPRKDGTFDIGDIFPGPYRIVSTLTPPGFYLKSVRCENRDLSGRILTLTAGAHARLEAVLSPNAASVTGTVSLSDSDVPAAEVTVILIPRKPIAARISSPTRRPPQTTPVSSVSATYPGQYKALTWELGETNATLYLDTDSFDRWRQARYRLRSPRVNTPISNSPCPASVSQNRLCGNRVIRWSILAPPNPP